MYYYTADWYYCIIKDSGPHESIVSVVVTYIVISVLHIKIWNVCTLGTCGANGRL